jgi:capsular polysaccharide transport system ATP-binding protein
MIAAYDLCKDYYGETGQTHRVLSDISFTINPGEKMAVLGRNGAGKSTLIRLLGGMEMPTTGRIVRNMTLSWPLALSGGIHSALTGNDNVRFIARIYGKEFKYVKAYVDHFAELGKFMSEPVRTYSAGMRARLAFGLSLAIDFDCYLIDEVIAVGDTRFHRKCQEELFEKRADRSLILASHEAHFLKTYCSSALILHRGRGKVFSDLDLAIDIYHAL